MRCKKCGCFDIQINTACYIRSVRRSFLWNLLMIILTGGLWVIWMCVRKKKEKVVREKMCTCKNCGYTWNIKY